MSQVDLDRLRRYAVSRTLFAPTTLSRALTKLGFVQADPIRAPARAQDLMLRHRVKNYRIGDLERLYPRLCIEEDVFINYGFLGRATHALMHPRHAGRRRHGHPSLSRQAAQLLRFVRDRGAVHPRDVDEHFAMGRVTNYWGGTSSATTHLLEKMHYRGVLRVVRRDNGLRVYAVHLAPPGARDATERDARIDALIDVLVHTYAPLPRFGLSHVISRLRYAVPQWRSHLPRALLRARARLARATVDGVDWYWPAGDRPGAARYTVPDRVRFLTPFDPLVWDRRRFELLWHWTYRFEAYTPVARRKLGYYALPLLWRDRVIGWANVSVRDGALQSEFGFVGPRPTELEFERELEAELVRMRHFLAV